MNNDLSGHSQNDNQHMSNNFNRQVKNIFVKTLAIIGGIVVSIIILSIIIFSLVSSTSDKLVCKSDEGNITIMYNESTIVGYTANGISYDLNQQKRIANQIGIDSYISQFTIWFETNTTGTCSVKEK